MERTHLTSTALVSAGYDAAQQTLEIEFAGGRVYRYRGVPDGVYAWLLRTPSKGAFVSRKIDGQYPHEEVTPATEPADLLAALQRSLDPREPPEQE